MTPNLWSRIQPGKLQAYIHAAVSGGAADDGLLQHFGLPVWPNVGREWHNVDRLPDTAARNAAFETFQRLDAMQPGCAPESGEPAPAVYRFAPDAQAEFDDWVHDFETALRSGEHHPAMESNLSKYQKLIPAPALVCALADDETEVSMDSLWRARAWGDYFKSHAARTCGAGTGPNTDGAAALLAKIQAGKVTDGFAVRDVYLARLSGHSLDSVLSGADIKPACGQDRRIEVGISSAVEQALPHQCNHTFCRISHSGSERYHSVTSISRCST